MSRRVLVLTLGGLTFLRTASAQPEPNTDEAGQVQPAPSEEAPPSTSPPAAPAQSDAGQSDAGQSDAGQSDAGPTASQPRGAPQPGASGAPPDPGAGSSGVTDGPQADEAPADASVSDDGPVLELAEEHEHGAAPGSADQASAAPDASSAVDDVIAEAPATTVGGYAQINVTSVRRGSDADFETSATVDRLVLLLSHRLSQSIRAHVEIEWEDAIACSTCAGATEVEQAFVDWQWFDEAMVLRSGLVLVPMGLINQWHEPPVFHGVERPGLDQTVIPTTWRELAVGFTGDLEGGWSYEAYVGSSLQPQELGPQGLVGARSLGADARLQAVAGFGSLQYEPLLGLSLGLTAYATDAGANGEYFTSEGDPVDFTFPVYGGSLFARLHRRGVEAKLVGAAFLLPEAGALMNAHRADGGLLFPNADRTGAVPTRIQGGYAELAYDLLHGTPSGHQLLPFVRAETYDTQAAVPDGFRSNRALTVRELTLGVSYRPIPQLVFKSDVQWRDRRYGLDELQLNAGMGYML